jgi:hypothetical protein
MGLLLEDEADCLNHQHKHRRHRRPIRRQSWAAAPYRASGLVRTAKTAIDMARGPTAAQGRKCEFAGAGSCRPTARCSHRQQSAALLT